MKMKENLSYLIPLFMFYMVISGCTEPVLSPPLPDQTGHQFMLTPQQMEQDIDFLVKTIEDSHPAPYAYISHRDFKKAIKQVRQACQNNISIDQFYFQTAWLAGQLRNGHTNVSQPKGWKERACEKVFPLYFWIEHDQVFLQGGHNLEPQYKGTQVIAIQEEPAFDVLRRYANLPPREARNFDPDIVFNPNLLWYCLALDYGQDKLKLKLKDKTGQIEDIEIHAVIYEEIFQNITTTSASDQKSPITYNYHSDCRTGIIKVKTFGPPPQFSDAIKEAFTDLKEKNAENLIIDVRDCPGGNSLFSDELIGYLTDKEFTDNIKGKLKYSKLYIQQRGKDQHYIAKSCFSLFTGGNLSMVTPPVNPGNNTLRFNGTLYVLINGSSRSTAGSFATVIKHYNLGTLIGEQTGETMVRYGDSLSFTLPNSQLACSVACKQYIMPGTTKENASQGVQPHIYIRPSLEDIWNNRDPVMEYALESCSCENKSK